MPDNIKFMIGQFKKDYRNEALNHDEARARMAGYFTGLRDAGFITEAERKILFVFCTV